MEATYDNLKRWQDRNLSDAQYRIIHILQKTEGIIVVQAYCSGGSGKCEIEELHNNK